MRHSPKRELNFLNVTLLAALLALPGGRAVAQVFKVQGGTSTLLNAEGGSVEFKAPNYDGNVGMGFFDGHFEYGAEARRLFNDYTLLAGDDMVPFNLPTDIFDGSHYFSARGVGATRKDSEGSFYAFAGMTSTWLGTGFFNAATSDDPVGIFFYERKLTERLRFFSRDIVSNRQTALQGLEWKQNKWLTASLAGGIGSNQKYFASAIDGETQKFAFKASYVVMGDMFRRVTVASPLSSEVNKGNVQMLYTPNQFVSITTGHENILEPLTLGGPMQQASVNQLSVDLHIERFYFGTGLFASTAAGRSTRGTNFYVGRRVGQRFEFNANYFRSAPQGTPATATTTTSLPTAPTPTTLTTSASSLPGAPEVIVSGTVRERVSSRFSLLQLISRTGGQTTVSFGGDFTSNRLMLRVDYENVYLPFRPAQPFEQALALNAALRVTGPWQITAASNVAPDGHLRYAFGMSTYLYRINGMMTNASADSFSIAKYLVQGVVKDDQDNPVEGAALYVGKQLAYTDSSGRFIVRFSKRGPFLLRVAPGEFINNGVYEVVSAPAQVRADSEDNAHDAHVVVRRVPPGQAKPATEQGVEGQPSGWHLV
jgi:hypothetical protein